MYKAFYGTQDLEEHVGMTGSLTFFNRWTSNLQKAGPDIWMRSSTDGTQYEYRAVYVDDLAIYMKDPQAFSDTLKEKYKLKLKGVGPLSYHLGCRYTRDEDGTLFITRQLGGTMAWTVQRPMPGWQHTRCSTSTRYCGTCSEET